MELQIRERTLIFEPVELNFKDQIYSDVFATKNNKTLQETILHKKYEKLATTTESKYASYLNWKLGDFLITLKKDNDPYYLKFLNKNGDLNYSEFHITDKRYLMKKGLYVYATKGDLKYIGRCRDNFRKRINQGYGKIHPKNCFIDGQSTNCHLNHLVTMKREDIQFLVCVLEDDAEINLLEQQLIGKYQPEWNIGFKNARHKKSHLFLSIALS
ncbi:hypothetical protein ACJ7K1_00155 [Paenibacillus elgii]